MLSRSLAILFASWLPVAALILPLGPAHRISALVSGILGTALSGFALASDRARVGGAIIGAWVALTAFIFPSTLLEEVIALSWGISMVACLAGPFSAPPATFRVAVRAAGGDDARDRHLPLAA